MDVNPYRAAAGGTGRFVLEIIVILMTCINIVVEFGEFIVMCVHFRALEYITDPFNLVGKCVYVRVCVCIYIYIYIYMYRKSHCACVCVQFRALEYITDLFNLVGKFMCVSVCLCVCVCV